jgi:phosphomannomutase
VTPRLTPEEWIAHDPDPAAVAELSACTPEELAARFRSSLTFGTAGLRGPMRAGPAGMNLAVVIRATWALSQIVRRNSTTASAFVGYDARHHSRRFATATAEVLAAEGFSVTLFSRPLPTPVLAFAVRHSGAAAGVQITASHNPPADNGYKVYLDGGAQIVPPIDREIESAIASAPHADEIERVRVLPSDPTDVVESYLDRAAGARSGSRSVRVALTPLHGVGGDLAVDALRRAGFSDIHLVATQFDPDPDFPTVAFPNPEEPGAADALLDLAARVDADIAVALDPDADRCAIGIPAADGWRMLSGDETGWLLGDYILRRPATAARTVASTVVSSRLLAAIAAEHHARHVETLTGFKWLARAAGDDLVFAYEEAIGYCVDPEAVRDKDGISAAVLCCDLAASAKAAGAGIPELLDDLARRHGVHLPMAVTARTDDAAAAMARVRANPPSSLAGFAVTATECADVMILNGNDDRARVRLAIRPSGTEPKVKVYIEISLPATDDVATVRSYAGDLCEDVRRDAVALLRGST